MGFQGVIIGSKVTRGYKRLQGVQRVTGGYKGYLYISTKIVI